MKTVLIIGASRGIGLEWAKHFTHQVSFKVYATCRKENRDLQNLAHDYQNLTVIPDIDVAQDKIIDFFEKSKVLPQTLDLVIFNSGVFYPEPTFSVESIDFATSLDIYNVNAHGPMRCYLGLKQRLARGSKFVFISTAGGSLTDPRHFDAGWPILGFLPYKMSKCAANLFFKCLSSEADVKSGGLIVGCIHPGTVDTDILAGIEVEKMTSTESVDQMAVVVQNMKADNSGTFWNYDGELISW